jgi:hypothetical protein
VLGIVAFLSTGLLAISQDIDSQGFPTIHLNLPPWMPDRNPRNRGSDPDIFTTAIVHPARTEDRAWTNRASAHHAAPY